GVLEPERGGCGVGAWLGVPADPILTADLQVEMERPHLQFVTAVQRRLTADTLTVQVGAVDAAEVEDNRVTTAQPHQAMVPADIRHAQTQVAIGAATDQELFFRD